MQTVYEMSVSNSVKLIPKTIPFVDHDLFPARASICARMLAMPRSEGSSDHPLLEDGDVFFCSRQRVLGELHCENSLDYMPLLVIRSDQPAARNVAN
jgi:hypothetical protein